MRKIILCKLNKSIAGIVYDHWNHNMEAKEEPCYVDLFQEANPSLIGNIYVGHVRDVVKNIEAAFVEYEKENLGYLSLKNCSPVFLCRKNTDKICEGDNIIVQITKDKIKTKAAVMTTNFSLPGRFAVITHGKAGITFSAKIKDELFREIMSRRITDFIHDMIPDCPYGILIRTEGYTAEWSDIQNELLSLDAQHRQIIETTKTQQKYYELHESESRELGFINKHLTHDTACEIITDDGNLYENIMESGFLQSYPCTLRFYEDSLLPLYKLYSLETLFNQIHSRKVWLKSGAYLVIDYTEAMTVIDVNTGKCEKGKEKEKTFLNINLEAAGEIARQMRIRNLSGIILVDFIDMKDESSIKTLLEYTRTLMSEDPIKTTVVDITRLHLMEITRQKTTDRIPYIPELFSLPNTD